MPPKKQPWFRFYVETIADRKIRRLPVTLRWLWVVVLACAKQSPIRGFLMLTEDESLSDEDLADAAALKLPEVKKGLAKFASIGLIGRDQDLNCWYVTRWKERQFESDDIAERTAKHRAKERRKNSLTSEGKNGVSPPDGTPIDPVSSRALVTETEEPEEPETENPPPPSSKVVENAALDSDGVAKLREIFADRGHDLGDINACLARLKLRSFGAGEPVKDWFAWLEVTLPQLESAHSEALEARQPKRLDLEDGTALIVHPDGRREFEEAP